ncbi:RNA 2',3'-cyclic phosphodiesterase [Photobacterium aquae]|nr:RNA 2',3'-cyclic phosphodiesterase [Photobacterium aquae]
MSYSIQTQLYLTAMKEKKQRLFFALEPDKNSADYPKLRQTLSGLPRNCRPVPVDNLHLTLAFVGSVAPAVRQSLERSAARIAPVPQFHICLDQLGYWARSRILWLGTSSPPPALQDLASQLRDTTAACGLPTEHRPYLPHITLAKSVPGKPTPPVSTLPLRFHFRRFGLYISEPAPHGGSVRYTCIADWPLAPN